jgi:hypothetical protein
MFNKPTSEASFVEYKVVLLSSFRRDKIYEMFVTKFIGKPSLEALAARICKFSEELIGKFETNLNRL